jgi:hypothetical protein
MIFPQYQYKSFHNENKSEWALQPPTNENWCKMVNECNRYCENLPLSEIFEFEKYNVKPTDYSFPSSHPYFSFIVYVDLEKSQLDKTLKIKQCILDHNKTKLLFNASADIKELQKDVEKKLIEIKAFYDKI